MTRRGSTRTGEPVAPQAARAAAPGKLAVSRVPRAYGIELADRGVVTAPASVDAPVVPASGRVWRTARDGNGVAAGAASAVSAASASPGSRLPDLVMRKFETALATDLSAVRVHTGAASSAAAAALGAKAYTLGDDIHFGAGHYDPSSAPGQRLLAHEVAHTVQSSAAPQIQCNLEVSSPGDPLEHDADRAADAMVADRAVTLSTAHGDTVQRGVAYRDVYTPAERRSMAQGQSPGDATDEQIAARCGFEPGDIVFRLGSRQLASRIGDPVTHGGIYLGGGVVHDMVSFGNRTVPLVYFYAEAEDPSVVRMVRFIGPLRERIIARLLADIRSRDFDLPTDPVPWNLFSSATDYRTATCLEYAHAQFLHAVRRIDQDASLDPTTRAVLRQTYFAGAGAQPQPLIAPQALSGSWSAAPSVERWVLVGAADALAEDVDPSVFRNRWEGTTPLLPGTPSSLTAFTWRSFVNATRFFQSLSCGDPSGASARLQQQVLPIAPATTTNVTDPIDRTVTRQTGVAWAERGEGAAFLVLLAIENSSVGRGTHITFRGFVDQDLRSRALARGMLRQPRGIQTIPWSAIDGIPSSPTATAARR